MDFWEIIKYLGGDVSILTVLGLWLRHVIKENNQLKKDVKALNDYRHESDRANLTLLHDMQGVLATLMSSTDRLSEATKDKIDNAVKLILSDVRNLKTLIEANYRNGKE